MRIGLYLLGWFGLMFVGLQIQQLDLGHWLCGQWGCGPPVAAVLGMHVFWLAVILPPSIMASRYFQWPWPKICLLYTSDAADE